VQKLSLIRVNSRYYLTPTLILPPQGGGDLRNNTNLLSQGGGEIENNLQSPLPSEGEGQGEGDLL